MDRKEGSHSQSFLIRVWVEEVGNGRIEYRGQVKHIRSAETAYFREWYSLQSFLKRKLEEKESAGTTA